MAPWCLESGSCPRLGVFTWENQKFWLENYRGGSRGTVQGVRKKKKTMWFIGVEVEQETSAPPPKKNPGSAPELNDSRH